MLHGPSKPDDMWRRAASRVLAVCSLVVCILIYTWSFWTWDPTLLAYPIVGGAAATPFVLARLWLMRHGRAADGLSSALEVLGLGLVAAPVPGLVLAVALSLRNLAPECGVGDPHAAATILRMLWPVWVAGEALLLARVAFRARALASLPPVSLAATVLTLVVTPPLATLALVAVALELRHGGAAMLTLYPLAVAGGATAVAWMLRIDLGSMRALRIVSALAALVTVLVTAGSRGSECTAFSSTQTWQLVARDRYGWIVAVLAMALMVAQPPPRGARAPSSA